MPWYKGNLHCHSYRSDGRATPSDVGLFYRSKGYHFLGLSDHNRLTPPDQWADPAGILGIPCSEFSGEACCHVVGVGVNAGCAPARSRRRKPRRNARILQEGVDAVLAAGGIPVVCHPTWRWTLSHEDIASLHGCRHFEVCNASPDSNAYPIPGYAPNDAIWDQLLTAGQRYFGMAHDDAHEYYSPFGPYTPHAGRGFNVVRAPALTAAGILEALREGRFYASTGLELKSYRVTSSGITLVAQPVSQQRVSFQFIGAGGMELATVIGERASYRFSGEEGYVRVRMASTCGHWAWTQPVFLDDLDAAIRWTARA